MVKDLQKPKAAPSPATDFSARNPIVAGFITLFLLVVCFGGWGAATTISGAIIATGKIEVEQNRQIVQHPNGGVVTSVHVVEGQAVKAGDLLLRLDGAAVKSELVIVEGQFFEALAQRARLEAERDDKPQVTFMPELLAAANRRAEVAGFIDGQRMLFHARRENMARQIDQQSKRRTQIASQIAGIDAQSNALDLQLSLIKQELNSQKQLQSKGLTQTARVLALQRETARLEGQMGELAANRAQSLDRITEIEIESLKIGAARQEEANTQLRDIGFRALELAERRRALNERVARLDIVAPVSGIVFGLQVTTPRAVLRGADTVLYLIPQDRPLVISVQIKPFQIDQIRIGQPAQLMFSGFPARTTPEIIGHISVISADVLTDQNTQMPYYRAEIVPEKDELRKLGGLTLLPGMPVKAFIRTDVRTPLAYLFKPFSDYFSRAFRES
jgi:HlyD family secretion protein